MEVRLNNLWFTESQCSRQGALPSKAGRSPLEYQRVPALALSADLVAVTQGHGKLHASRIQNSSS